MAVAQGTCPGCGAPIEFGVGSSIAKVCEYCRTTVVRSDRGLENLGKVADLAVQVHGGAGYMRGVPVERIYREVRLLRLYEGTSEIQRLIIGGGLVKEAQRKLRD